ncbi:2-C-methyl-D-erythritol 4-phosphate cytidylyltransferase [Mucilaginibacter gossypiicola]|uniref:2-C-methyl-D-erythritol 4-phosphate cytidylyltransferase n=1 Tax=Mucilaginibacter gossypiicola TaxID=551995 RepID=A0A1H8JSQ7_9SPHI|nr:2-C-methyl-D-erythritol 4-phosphate cytidylyltransferase [Mucilaginibacter gossypiicola]SEN83742.1 2-C-methyl-D-erythritol 4-phosphate cytidylyltransferase [Mucilaginibacter gossypiicola]
MMTSNLTSHISHLISKNKNYVIIVAGGSGSRMQSTVPKQFLLLNRKPVLMHTIAAFERSEAKPNIILVLPLAYHSYWQQLIREHAFTIPHQLVTGGETRFHSVKNGLDLITDNEALVAVHDAVRPLISPDIIDEAYQYAAEYGTAVVAVKSRDSIRQVKDGRSVSLIRDEIYLVQTPQTFKASLLRKAYEQPFDTKFTDDASVVEQYGAEIKLTEGNHSNIKITFPEDIAIAELLLSKKPQL